MVSIITATYNRAHYILETLKSIQNQTFENWECLIIDDGGNDNTQEVIKPLLEVDTRFQFFKRPDTYLKGLPGCRNYGLDLARGEYIIFFDDDDIVHPLNLELCIKEILESEYKFCRYERAVFSGDFDYNFNYSKEYTSFLIGEKDLGAMLMNFLPFNSCAVMWKRECFIKSRFIEHLMYAEEWELYSRILASGVKGISISKKLYFGRKHQNSNTGEFYSNNPIRVKSKIEAIKLVYDNLIKNGNLTFELYQYLLNYSNSFNDKSLIKYVQHPPYSNIFKWLIYKGVNIKVWLYQLLKKQNN